MVGVKEFGMSNTPFFTVSGPQYAWEVATLFPEQGEWSEEEYLWLTDGTNRLIEFTDGQLEFLPVASEIHQMLNRFLFLALYQFVERLKLGEVHFSGLRLRVRPGKIRQPDVIFLQKDNYHVRHNRVWDGADLVMEIVSDDEKDRQRDYETKIADYAAAGVLEYWIVDPEERTVIVHYLREVNYSVHGRFHAGQKATSVLLPDFSIDVAELFAALDSIPE